MGQHKSPVCSLTLLWVPLSIPGKTIRQSLETRPSLKDHLIPKSPKRVLMQGLSLQNLKRLKSRDQQGKSLEAEASYPLMPSHGSPGNMQIVT